MDFGIEFLVASDPHMEELKIKLTSAEMHNKKLKNLSMYHLDLIMKQHELMTKREKAFEALKHENARLRNKLNRMARKASFNKRQSFNPPPPVDEASSPSAAKKGYSPPSMFVRSSSSTVVKEEAPSASAVVNEYYSPPMDTAYSLFAVVKEETESTPKIYGL